LKKALNPLGGRMAKRAAMRCGFNDNSSAKHYDKIRMLHSIVVSLLWRAEDSAPEKAMQIK
jgi:hypothetical protein